MRITPNNITKLEPNQIFVFGSNESGRHGAGAARQALTWGAIWGQPRGLQGRTYGIPTKNASIQKTLSIPKIQTFVNEFIEYSKSRPDLIFLVTEIGCGLAGLSQKDVGPLFKEAIDLENVYLPKKFIQYIK
jgi:hypothetical protein